MHIMNLAFEAIQPWFNQRSLRERSALLALALVLWVVIFRFFIFSSVEKQNAILSNTLSARLTETTAWEAQLSSLKKIADGPLYQEWNKNQKKYAQLQNNYENTLTTPTPSYWQNIIKTILKSQPKVVLEQINSEKESLFEPLQSEKQNTLIYEQPMQLVVSSDYFNTILYLKSIEDALPNIHWDKLTYQVTQYPLARINMEFSILYEKNA